MKTTIDKLNFSCLPLSFYQDVYDGKISPAELSATIGRAGYDAFDINETIIKDMDDNQLLKLKETLAIPVLTLCVYSDFTNSDPEVIAEEMKRAKANVKKANLIGAKYIRLTTGPSYDYCDNDKTITQICNCFSSVACECEKYGIRILMENHLMALSWSTVDYNFDYERMALLCKSLESLPVGINYDTANAYALGKWMRMLKLVLPKTETLHVNDIKQFEPFDCSVIGEGLVPIKMMLGIIFDSGFDGWISIEEASRQGFDGLERALVNLKEMCSAMLDSKESEATSDEK